MAIHKFTDGGIAWLPHSGPGTIDLELANSHNWSWWTRPRAVAYDGRVYIATTANDGSVAYIAVNGTTGDATQTLLTDLGTQDDHLNGALILQTGQKPLTIYTNHVRDQLVRWRLGATNIENVAAGNLNFGDEQTKNVAADTSYAVAHVHDGDIYVFYRAAQYQWDFIVSTDGGATFSDPDQLIKSASNTQFYMASVVSGDTLRCACAHHPVSGSGAQVIYYFEVDLTSGAITKADGSSIGTMGTVVNSTSCDVVYTVAAGNNQWVFDIGDGPEPEITFMEFDADTPDTTGMYKYAVFSGGSWTVNNVVASGQRFVAGTGDTETYYGSHHIPRNTPGGVVYSSRYDSGASLWKVEKHTTANDGATWTSTLLDSSPDGSPLVRAFPIEGDASVPWTLVAVEIDSWATYANWTAHLRLITEPP